MTDKQNNPDPIAHAARMLREAAEELRQAHAYNNSEGWENETDAKAAYDEHLAAAQALEDWEAAVGAGGMQALSAAPAIGDELRDTLVAVSAAIAERDDRAAQKMICEILAASPAPPAEQQTQPGAVYAELPQPDSWFHFTPQYWVNKLRDFANRTHALRMEQAAPKAAPGGQNTVPAEWLEQAYREGWAACRDAETIGEEAEDWAFGNSTANSRMIDAQQAAPEATPGEPDYSEKWDAELGRTAMRFVDRAGDVHPGIDDAETICAEFHKAMSEVIERMPHVQRMAAPQQEAQEPVAISEAIERMAADRYKVVPSHESMFHRWAVVAGTGTQQLYLGREVECQNMARKFAGAFLDGAFVAMQQAAPQPAPAPLSEREAFEAWIKKDGGDLGTFGTPPNMHYGNSAVNNAWVAWKARAAIAAQGGK